MWLNKEISIGDIAEKTTHEVMFEYVGLCVPVNFNARASCGCTSVRWNDKQRVLTVKYNGSSIPRHLALDQIPVKKSIKITYLCDNESIEETLFIVGTLKKKL